jgi:two-component system, LytTR family, sensor kinase
MNGRSWPVSGRNDPVTVRMSPDLDAALTIDRGMTHLDAPELLHIVGYLTGASLYAMLLVMVVRSHRPTYGLTLGTAVLGLAWNVGELTAHLVDALGMSTARDWLAGFSYGALGFLAAVVVHSAASPRDNQEGPAHRRASELIVAGAYTCATAAGLMQLFAAGWGIPLPWSAALVLLTTGLTLLAAALLVSQRGQQGGRRALWTLGLALFAVSALHLGSFHGTAESWTTELLGHHASIPLAFAILYQDYRFAFADVFLKRALTVLALVSGVFVSWSVIAPSIARESAGSPAIGLLMGMWVGTALLFPWLQRRMTAFVDRVLLKRPDYSTMLERLTTSLQTCDSEEAALAHACAALGPALSAESVTWHPGGAAHTGVGRDDIVIPTAESPRPVLTIGRLAGGRRLLSDDLLLLERAAHLVSRRIDTIRFRDERYERMLREREIGTLAAQAELRALRAQINPHFLFNTLTTLGYLIQAAPSRALDTLMRLTTLLRSALRSEGDFTTLGHEAELIACYLEIERERFEERLDARVEIPAALRQVSIPALVVQPLVENAVRHGIAGSRDGGSVIVSASVSDDPAPALHVVVRNTGAPLGSPTARPGSGIGLQNVAQRLRCYYGESATLTLSSAAGETVATIRLPMQRLAATDADPVHEFIQT